MEHDPSSPSFISDLLGLFISGNTFKSPGSVRAAWDTLEQFPVPKTTAASPEILISHSAYNILWKAGDSESSSCCGSPETTVVHQEKLFRIQQTERFRVRDKAREKVRQQSSRI
ncbi:Uncharacterized protein DAT39_005759, partial [Clarias magur]